MIFGASPSLKGIGIEGFSHTKLSEIRIPDSVGEVGDKGSARCRNPSIVTFGESSSLKFIGFEAFRESCVVDIRVPDNVEEISDQCFFL